MNSYLLCDACGQVHTITKEGVLNSAPIRFCPTCGAPALRPIKSIIKEQNTAVCFRGIDAQLLNLLLSVWSQERNGLAHPTFPAFIDYLKEQLA